MTVALPPVHGRQAVELVAEVLGESLSFVPANVRPSWGPGELQTLATALIVLCGLPLSPEEMGPDIVDSIRGSVGFLADYSDAQPLFEQVRLLLLNYKPGARVDKPAVAQGLMTLGLENVERAIGSPDFADLQRRVMGRFPPPVKGALMADDNDVMIPDEDLDADIPFEGESFDPDFRQPTAHTEIDPPLEGLDASEWTKVIKTAADGITDVVKNIPKGQPSTPGTPSTPKPPAPTPPTPTTPPATPPAPAPPVPPAPAAPGGRSVLPWVVGIGLGTLAVGTLIVLVSRSGQGETGQSSGPALEVSSEPLIELVAEMPRTAPRRITSTISAGPSTPADDLLLCLVPPPKALLAPESRALLPALGES